MRYRFIARGEDGGQKTGFLEAADEQGAREQLQRRRLQVTRLEVDQSGPPPARQAVATKPTSPTKPTPPVPPKPASVKKSEPSLLSMLDWRRLGLAFVTLLVLAGIGAILWKRAARDKDYRLHLSGHLALVSRQELGADYPDRIQLGLRLKRPEWQIDRDGSIQERGEDGKFHRTQRHAKVAFQLGVEGDYTMEVQTSLPSTPDQITFLVDAPGFPPKQKEVKLTAGPGQELQGQIEPITLHRLKKRETRASAATQETTPSLDSNSSLPKYDPEGPEPDT